MRSTENCSSDIEKLKQSLAETDTVVIGAGAGLSTAAGFVYSGERFDRYFSDFGKKYGFSDMYYGGFYPYETRNEFWGFWCRNIWANRYTDAPEPIYEELLGLVADKDYFIITTNVDHCFQKAGADKKRLFYTQGDYGLFQCSAPCHRRSYDNESVIRDMIESQGWRIEPDDSLTAPEGAELKMTVPDELLPVCPVCGRPMTMNLRSDDRFAEDEGWHQASERYTDFLRTRKGKILFLELGVGYNTPVIIKFPFWNMTEQRPEATYVCINHGEADCPEQIRSRSICIDGDIGSVLKALKNGQTH